jgi:hypothetical protein
MYYNDLYYYDNENQVIQNLRTMREEVKDSDPIGRYSFRRSGLRTGFDLTVQGLLYFSNLSVLFREDRIGRNDWTDNYVRNLPRISNDTPANDLLVGNPTTVTFVHVAGQVTNFFENTLKDCTPIHALDEDSVITEQSWEEINGLSLALKCSPKHRVRVYKYTTKESDTNVIRDQFIIYSAKSFSDEDIMLKRKVIAALPYMLNLKEDHPLTPILRSVEHDACDAWMNTVNTYLNSINKYVNYSRFKLIQSFQVLNSMHTDALTRRKNDIDVIITRILDDYREKLQQQRDILNEIAGMSDETLSTEDIELLIEHNIIKDLSVRSHREATIEFLISSPVLAYEKAAAEKYYNTINDDAEIYKTMFKHVFIEEDSILHFTDRIRVNFSNYTFEARSSMVPQPNNTIILRNPHHAHYNCWGGYGSIITKLISEFNYMQLFMQIKAGVGSLNMTDYTVLSQFKNDIERLAMYNNQPKVIAFKEEPKVMYTISEAYDIWKRKEEQTNETNSLEY